jgi:hypothetical protein
LTILESNKLLLILTTHKSDALGSKFVKKLIPILSMKEWATTHTNNFTVKNNYFVYSVEDRMQTMVWVSKVKVRKGENLERLNKVSFKVRFFALTNFSLGNQASSTMIFSWNDQLNNRRNWASKLTIVSQISKCILF